MEIASNDHHFFLRFEQLLTPRSAFEAQGDAHGEIDLRLVQAIEELLAPSLGNWEGSGSWFHQLDFYGDGVRSLTFSRAVFPYDQVRRLQALLQGEYAPFCILCIATDKLSRSNDETASEADDDYLAIFAERLLATKALAMRCRL